MIEWFTPNTTIATLNEGDFLDFSFSVTGYDTLEFISGNLPPGIEFINNSLSGIVGNILNPFEEIFSFTIRAKNSEMIFDRDFSIICYPINRQNFFDQSSLPLIRDEFGCYDLGSYSIGDLFIWTFSIIELDNDSLSFSYSANNLTTLSDIIPKSLNLRNDGYFEGVIQEDALIGIYRFDINVLSEFDSIITLPFKLEIKEIYPNTISDLVFIEPTIANELIFVSGELSNVLLTANSSETITYSIAPGSETLPNGLILDSLGMIKGITFNDPRKEFYVTFRLSVNNFYIDKKVKIKIINNIQYYPNKIYLNITGLQQKKLNQFKSSLLLPYLYRLGDEFFNSGDALIELSNWIKLTDLELYNLINNKNEIRLIGGDFFVREIKQNNIVIYKELIQKIIDKNNSLKLFENFNKEIELVIARLTPNSDVLNNVEILRTLREFQGINYVFKQITKTDVKINQTKFDILPYEAKLTYIIENENKLLIGPITNRLISVKLNKEIIPYTFDNERIYFNNSSGEIEILINSSNETIFDGIPYTLHEINFDSNFNYVGKYFKLRDIK